MDPALVRAGCLLHDLGVYRLGPAEAYVRHGLLGHEFLAAEGLPEALGRFCSHHTMVAEYGTPDLAALAAQYGHRIG